MKDAPSYTMSIGKNTPILPFNDLGFRAILKSPQEYAYNACPRCQGTLYSPPHVKDFSCLVCGWVKY